MDFLDLFSFDKMAHLLCFGLLFFFAASGLTKYLHFSFLRNYSLRWALLYCIFLGAATEISQAFLAIHRTGDWLDFFADCIGIGLGLLVYLMVYKVPIKE